MRRHRFQITLIGKSQYSLGMIRTSQLELTALHADIKLELDTESRVPGIAYLSQLSGLIVLFRLELFLRSFVLFLLHL